MKHTHIAGCFMTLLMLAGCSETPPPAPDTSAADRKAIQDGETAWANDWASRDADKIASHYADNATMIVPDSAVMQGKDAIRTGLQNLMADKNASLAFTAATTGVSKGGDLAYTQGSYSMTMSNPRTKKPESEKGNYVVVYKKQADGSWKAIEDISSAQAPPAISTVAAKKRKKEPVARKKKKRA